MSNLKRVKFLKKKKKTKPKNRLLFAKLLHDSLAGSQLNLLIFISTFCSPSVNLVDVCALYVMLKMLKTKLFKENSEKIPKCPQNHFQGNYLVSQSFSEPLTGSKEY